jgi:hypothetical protein
MQAHRPEHDPAPVVAAIHWHHKLTRAPHDAGRLTEAFRRADLVDLSLGRIRFGLPRPYVAQVRGAFPNAGFHRALAVISLRWLVAHPLRPLPMVRW